MGQYKRSTYFSDVRGSGLADVVVEATSILLLAHWTTRISVTKKETIEWKQEKLEEKGARNEEGLKRNNTRAKLKVLRVLKSWEGYNRKRLHRRFSWVLPHSYKYGNGWHGNIAQHWVRDDSSRRERESERAHPSLYYPRGIVSLASQIAQEDLKWLLLFIRQCISRPRKFDITHPE